jgi:hypothetical protein
MTRNSLKFTDFSMEHHRFHIQGQAVREARNDQETDGKQRFACRQFLVSLHFHHED